MRFRTALAVFTCCLLAGGCSRPAAATNAPAGGAVPAAADPPPAPAAPAAHTDASETAATMRPVKDMAGAPAVVPASNTVSEPAADPAPDAAAAAADDSDKPSTGDLLRSEVATWKKTPYVNNGTSKKKGIGNSQFARAVLKSALGTDVPAELNDQLRTGKLVTRKELEPGDLVFFEHGFGPFKSHAVGVYLGQDQVAIALKDLGVGVVKLSDKKWDDDFKTARRVQSDANTKPPTFDATAYGANRAALLRDIADAWKGTLYERNGTSFEGIDNDEFVRQVYEMLYETELDGTPKQWATEGKAVKRTALEPGDIILYETKGVAGLGLFRQEQAGIYISNGEFVHAIKGQAVMISKLSDPEWSKAYKTARRLDPDVLTRLAEERAAAAARRAAAPTSKNATSAKPAARSATSTHAAPAMPARELSVDERGLREATQEWWGTPYRLGGDSKSGVDCSAFVRAVFEEVYKVDLPRTAAEQEELGVKVDRKNLETGDLIFFRTQGLGPFFKSHHVAVYLGNGEFAHASSSHGVTISRLDNYYWNKKFHTARRLTALIHHQ